MHCFHLGQLVILIFFYIYKIVIEVVLCVFIERETHKFILKFRKIFPWRKTVLRAHGMKSDENQFFCQIYVFFCKKKKKKCTFCDL